MSRLSNDIALTTGGVTRLVDRMVEAGLVERQACPSDRRSIHVILTPEGRDVLGEDRRFRFLTCVLLEEVEPY